MAYTWSEVKNNLATTLGSDITDAVPASGETMAVTSTAGFPAVGYLALDSGLPAYEIIHYSSISGSSFVIGTRGADGTSAHNHSTGAAVELVIVAAHINELRDYDNLENKPTGTGHTIQDEGTPLTTRANLNFVGAAVTVADDAGNDATVVTIPGASVETDPIFLARAVTTAHYTGFPNRTDTTLAFVAGAAGATRTLTLGGTNFKIYINGTEYTIASDMTKQIDDVTGLYWFWIDLVGGTPTLEAQVGAPGFDKCLVATAYWNTTTDAGVIGDERHWMGRDRWNHEYLHQTVGARWYTGGTLTLPTSSTFQLTQCEMYDEDIEHILSLATACRIFYKNGSANWEWDDNNTTLKKIVAGAEKYNSGNNLTSVSNSNHFAVWVFATNSTTYPFWVIIGQREDVTIASARANNTPDSLSYGTLPAAEMKLLYRVICKQGTTAPIEVADYRSVSSLPVTNYTATDHSVLSNLAFAVSGHTGFAAETHIHIPPFQRSWMGI